MEYFVMKEVWRKEVCAGLDAGAVAKALAARGMLVPDSDGKVQSRHKLPGTGKTTRYYRLTAAILGDDDA